MNKKAFYSLIFAGGLAVGGFGTGLYLKNQEQQPRDLTSLYNNMFDRDFFRQSHSPFAQMEKMQKEMDKIFESSLAFDDWYGAKFGGSVGDIKQSEDEKFVYYTLDMKGIDQSSLKTEVTGGQVVISGSSSNIQAEEERGQNVRSESYQSFHRSFPVPGGVDPNKVEFETKDDQLVIKFPKVPDHDRPVV